MPVEGNSPGDWYRRELEDTVIFPENKLGQGGEKVVYQHPHHPEKAVGVYHKWNKETAPQAKGRYYLGKLMHLLFPLNIPDIHLSTSNPQAIEVDRVIEGHEDVAWEKAKALYESIEAAGITVDLFIDNFLLDRAGNLLYIDQSRSWYVLGRSNGHHSTLHPKYNYDKLRLAIEKLPPDQQSVAVSYLERLQALFEEERDKLS